MGAPTDLLFIALLAPDEIQAKVTAFKQYAATNFDSKHALRSPPHITLIPPFRWPLDDRKFLIDFLTNFQFAASPFPLHLYNFDCFAPRVIFVDVVEEPKLYQLQAQLAVAVAEELGIQHQGPHDFHPHMTIAFRDLQVRVFPAAWSYFSSLSFQASFPVDKLALLRHTHVGWQLVQTFPLVI